MDGRATGGGRMAQVIKRRAIAGFTMVEVMVYTGILALVFGIIYFMFEAGMKYYNTARAGVSIQEAAQKSTYLLKRELMESNLDGIAFYPNSTVTGVPSGVVFISPRDPANHDRFDLSASTGRARWHKYVCYYTQGTGDGSGTYTLYRKEYVPATINPDARPVKCAYNTSYFASATTLKSRVIATGLAASSNTLPRGGFTVFTGDPDAQNFAPEYNAPANPICIQLNLTNRQLGRNNSLSTSMLVNVRN